MGEFRCSVCGDEFDDEESLAEHVKEAHPGGGSAEFECNICDETFSSKDELYAHIKSAHPNGK